MTFIAFFNYIFETISLLAYCSMLKAFLGQNSFSFLVLSLSSCVS